MKIKAITTSRLKRHRSTRGLSLLLVPREQFTKENHTHYKFDSRRIIRWIHRKVLLLFPNLNNSHSSLYSLAQPSDSNLRTPRPGASTYLHEWPHLSQHSGQRLVSSTRCSKHLPVHPVHALLGHRQGTILFICCISTSSACLALIHTCYLCRLRVQIFNLYFMRILLLI